MSKKHAIERLQEFVSGAEALLNGAAEPDFNQWHTGATLAIRNVFENDQHHLSLFSNIRYRPIVLSAGMPRSELLRVKLAGVKQAKSVLAAMIDEIKKDWTEDTPALETADFTQNGKVFLVHGRDNEATQSVARFLERMHLQVVILSDEVNEGRTIIEKFEASSNVGFAIVLMTSDDEGRLKGTTVLYPRARQNVIFELGYFVGKLGRARVFALRQDDVEVPSDFSGVVYVPFDPAGAWKQALFRELKAAGYSIDSDSAFS